MKEKLAKLIDVKSIVTIMLVATLVIVTLKQIKTPELFGSVLMMVIGFFFGKQSNGRGEK